MYKYQQEIIEKFENMTESFREWYDDTEEYDELFVTFFQATLSPYAKKKFKEEGYSINHRNLHFPTPDPIESLPIIDMPCAKSNINHMGCYFVGMVGFNPITETSYYLVKVGFASDISRRIKQYANTNPMLYHNNCVLCVDGMNEEGYRMSEHTCHEFLARHAIGRAQNSNEWFYVSKETYLWMCERFADEKFFTKVACGEEE